MKRWTINSRWSLNNRLLSQKEDRLIDSGMNGGFLVCMGRWHVHTCVCVWMGLCVCRCTYVHTGQERKPDATLGLKQTPGRLHSPAGFSEGGSNPEVRLLDLVYRYSPDVRFILHSISSHCRIKCKPIHVEISIEFT